MIKELVNKMSWIDNFVAYVVLSITGKTIEDTFGHEVVAYLLLVGVASIFIIHSLFPRANVIEKRGHAFALLFSAIFAIFLLVFL